MRKILSLSVLLLAITFVIVNCTKEGPAGPAGPAGPQGNPGLTGPAGPAGPTGSANVIYSNWFSFAAADWADTAIYTINYRRAIRTVTSLTSAVFNNGVILSYWKTGNPTTNVHLIPVTLHYTDLTSYQKVDAFNSVGKIIYTCLNVQGGVNTPFNLIAPNEFRWIIIPGSILGGRTRDPRTMTYQEVCQAYGIPE